MKYKMIVSDFDCTLLRDDDTVSDNTIEKIEQYINRGGVFTISTGRMNASIIQRLAEIKLDKVSIPLMSYQGALVVDSVSGEVLKKIALDKEIVIKVAEFTEERGIYMHFYSEHNIYIAKETPESDYYCKKTKVEDKAVYVGKLSDYLRQNDVEIIKMSIVFKNSECGKLCNELNEKWKGRVNFVRSAKNLIESVSVTAGKGNTMLHIAETLGIKKEETIAIGDSMNDYSMIKMAGLGVAVENAEEGILEIAKLIAPSNNDDGVAYIIERAMNNDL